LSTPFFQVFQTFFGAAQAVMQLSRAAELLSRKRLLILSEDSPLVNTFFQVFYHFFAQLFPQLYLPRQSGL